MTLNKTVSLFVKHSMIHPLDLCDISAAGREFFFTGLSSPQANKHVPNVSDDDFLVHQILI